MGLPAEVQEQIIGFAVKLDCPLVFSETAPGDKYHVILDNARKTRVSNPTIPFQSSSHLLALAKDMFYRVNTFRINTKGINMLDDDIRIRPYIRHIEYVIPAEEIIARWDISPSTLEETLGVDELRVIKKFPKAFKSLKTVTVKLELSMKQLQSPGADKKNACKVGEKRMEIATTVLKTYLDIHFLPGAKGEIRKYIHLELGGKKFGRPTWDGPGSTCGPTHIDGRGKTAEELYSEMLDCVSAVARV